MSSLQIAHISDTHLGYRALFRSAADGRNQRAVDIERAYETAVEDILSRRREIALVIHSGDVFHQSRPSWSAIRCFIQQTRKLCEAGLPVLVIAGNHDTPRLRTTVTVFDILQLSLPDIRFVTRYEHETVTYDGLSLSVTAVPHGCLNEAERPEVRPGNAKLNILTTHGLINNLDIAAKYHEPGEQRLDDGMLEAGFDYVALGHIHIATKARANMAYSGSTERMGWGDRAARPSYSLVELTPGGYPVRISNVPVTARPMVQLGAVDGEGKGAREIADEILRSAELQAGPTAMVRVELQGTERPVRREVQSIVRREGPQVVWHLEVISYADAVAAFGSSIGLNGEAVASSLPALFDEFVSGQTYSEEFREAFRVKGHRALDEARAAVIEAGGGSE